ncbi:MAG: hypothetical protein PHC60_02075 [Heliobacteriaceae bacterium]|nr:hypothetical protein [Heliobacteriaceae bacterium]MDD4587165.1 hypothetical protein [Heliobacteriaceae bacterium]
MNGKLEAFNTDLDKIISGGAVTPLWDDEEYRQLLALAKRLYEADFSPESRMQIKDLLLKTNKNRELEDDVLDLVAGGLNLNEILKRGL